MALLSRSREKQLVSLSNREVYERLYISHQRMFRILSTFSKDAFLIIKKILDFIMELWFRFCYCPPCWITTLSFALWG